MNELIIEFMENKITLSDFVEKLNIQSHNIIDEEIHYLLNSYKDEDRSSLVYLILYFIYKHQFKDKTPFISFLDSIKDNTANNFNSEIIYHYLIDNVVIFQIDHLYFIVNNNLDPITVELPKDIQNGYQFCVNCNHELYFGEILILEPYEFYVISDDK